MAVGVPSEWIVALRALGFNTVVSLRSAKVNKLLNDLRSYAKKNKQTLPALTSEALQAWGVQE